LAPLASVVEEAQLPQDTPDVFGGSGDTAAVAIMHDIAAQRSTYVYMLRGRSFFKKDAVWVEVR
jgi:hypothetical protein